MGGFGSGRPSGSGRDTVEACRSLDVNRLHREGCLRAGWVGGWQWTRDGERVAWISLRAEADRLHLTYRVRIGGGDWEDVAETVRIVRVACRYGGSRPYFVCPGVVNGIVCGRRVAKLHAVGALFPVPALLPARPCQPERGRRGTAPCAAPTRSGSGSAAIPAWPRVFRRSRKACGGGPTSACVERAFEAEMRADEAYRASSRALLARIDEPKRSRTNRRRSYWR